MARVWGVIAPVYMRLGRYADAATAFRRLIELLGETPDRLGDLGEALTLANGGNVGDEARAAFQKVLAKDPANARAGFWLGIADEQARQVRRSRQPLQDAARAQACRSNVDSRGQAEAGRVSRRN